MTRTKKVRPRTYARNRAVSRKGREIIYESDGTYFFKLVFVLLMGTFWLKFAAPLTIGAVILTGIPLGLLIGLIIVSRFEHFQYDRKIWYATLLVVTVISYFVPAGIVI